MTLPDVLRAGVLLAKELRQWLAQVGCATLYIEPGVGGRTATAKASTGAANECLSGEILYSLREAQIVIANWRTEYNTLRLHSAFGYRPPAPPDYSTVGELKFSRRQRNIILSLRLIQKIGLLTIGSPY
jgi:hypothetical protein